MSGFADSFPDADVMLVLGDDITVVKSSGGSITIKGTFEYKYVEEDEAARLDVIYPVIECMNADASKVGRLDKLQYDNKTFSILKKRPLDVGMTQIILKN